MSPVRKFFRTVLILFACAVGVAQAGPITTFNLTWSGASFGNSATAVGQISLDESLLPNPGSYGGPLPGPFVLDLWIKISGASVGNGTFLLSDFNQLNWDTNGATLDLTTELVGQPTLGSAWGTPDANGGDFNPLAFTTGPPSGAWYFTLATSGATKGGGDRMLLTSFSPANAVPEPGLLGLAGLGIVGLYAWLRRRSR